MMHATFFYRATLSSFALAGLLSVNVPASEVAESAVTNPLLTESTLPYHLPPFEAIKDEHFAPAFEQGMAEELEEVATIAGNPAPVTFDNTIVALERSGALLDRVSTVFGILTG
jgi:peptidyl-dipeptidase Dcp